MRKIPAADDADDLVAHASSVLLCEDDEQRVCAKCFQPLTTQVSLLGASLHSKCLRACTRDETLVMVPSYEGCEDVQLSATDAHNKIFRGIAASSDDLLAEMRVCEVTSHRLVQVFEQPDFRPTWNVPEPRLCELEEATAAQKFSAIDPRMSLRDVASEMASSELPPKTSFIQFELETLEAATDSKWCSSVVSSLQKMPTEFSPQHCHLESSPTSSLTGETDEVAGGMLTNHTAPHSESCFVCVESVGAWCGVPSVIDDASSIIPKVLVVLEGVVEVGILKKKDLLSKEFCEAAADSKSNEFFFADRTSLCIPDLSFLLRQRVCTEIAILRKGDALVIDSNHCYWTRCATSAVRADWFLHNHATLTQTTDPINTALRAPLLSRALEAYARSVIENDDAFPSDVLSRLRSRLEDERIARRVSTEDYHMCVQTQPLNSNARYCERCKCSSPEIFHHYYFCKTCDDAQSFRNFGVREVEEDVAEEQNDVCEVLGTASYDDVPSYRRRSPRVLEELLRRGYPARAPVEKPVAPSSDAKKDRSMLPVWLRVGCRVLVHIKVSGNSNERPCSAHTAEYPIEAGTVIKTGHGFFTILLEKSGKTVVKRRAALDPHPDGSEPTAPATEEEHAVSRVERRRTRSGSVSPRPMAHPPVDKSNQRPTLFCFDCFRRHACAFQHEIICFERFPFSALEDLLSINKHKISKDLISILENTKHSRQTLAERLTVRASGALKPMVSRSFFSIRPEVRAMLERGESKLKLLAPLRTLLKKKVASSASPRAPATKRQRVLSVLDATQNDVLSEDDKIEQETILNSLQRDVESDAELGEAPRSGLFGPTKLNVVVPEWPAL